MYARITFVRARPGTRAEAERILRTSVVPAARKQRGFVRLLMLVSEEDPEERLCISLWRTREDALANEEGGYYQAQVRKFSHTLVRRPVRKGYLVVVDSSARSRAGRTR